MERLQTIAQGISRVGAIAGGVLLLLAAVTIFIDITLRYTVVRTLGGADELAGYALAIASAWGFSAALLSRSHIRIDTVYVRVRRPIRALLDVLSLAALAFFFSLVAWHAFGVMRQSWVSQSRSQSEIETLLVIPQGLWFAGPRVLRRGCAAAAGAVAFRRPDRRSRQAVRADRLEVGRSRGE